MSLFGRYYRLFTFGESHSPMTGCLIEGFPSNFPLDLAAIQSELDRRRPGQSSLSTPRNEADRVECVSGLQNGRTLGSPLCFLVRNENVKKSDYDPFKDVPRPGHADFTYLKKYGIKAASGGGRSSARQTIGRVISGAVAKQYLKTLNIGFAAWVDSVGNYSIPSSISQDLIRRRITNQQVEEYSRIWKYGNSFVYQRQGNSYSYNIESREEKQIANFPEESQLQSLPQIRCPHAQTASHIYQEIRRVQQEKDSLGGTIQGCIYGMPSGLGEPVFDKIQALLAHAMMSIPATKGFEFGSGFAGTKMQGSQHNDMFESDLRLKTNNSGGSLGGITSGQTFEFKVAFKPVSTIAKPQITSNLQGEIVTLQGKGRHDPCVLPRAGPIVDCMAATVVMDLVMSQRARRIEE